MNTSYLGLDQEYLTPGAGVPDDGQYLRQDYESIVREAGL